MQNLFTLILCGVSGVYWKSWNHHLLFIFLNKKIRKLILFSRLEILHWLCIWQDISASLCFRGQRIFLHNASGWFGNVPLEASGDFGIHPEEGEFHLMCQVWSYIQLPHTWEDVCISWLQHHSILSDVIWHFTWDWKVDTSYVC
jgi:hypothetical protein